jgi:hypothetical protein
LAALPSSLAELPLLEKLDLRWNPLGSLPDWIGRLRERGCVVLT